MKSHRRVREVARNELSEFESSPGAQSPGETADLCPAHRLIWASSLSSYMEALEKDSEVDLDALVAKELSHLVGVNYKPIEKPTDVILYGFGRIGRLVTRLFWKPLAMASLCVCERSW